MRPLSASLFRVLFAFALLAPVSVLATSPVSAATTIAPTTTCGNALGAVLAGRGLICEVTIVNTKTTTGGSAAVTVRECFGSAGAPTDGSGIGGFACTNKTISLTAPVTAVTQCNGSINGGGGTLRCSVKVTNNFVGLDPGATAATVNQCIGSGAGGIVGANIHCNPIQATTNAAITQCNGSANGLTLTSPVGLTCTVTGTMSSALPVKINQCNGSTNGGGALIICSASVINNAVAVTPTPAPSRTPPPTSTVGDRSSSDSMPLFPLMILFALAGLGLATVVVQRRSVRS